MINKILLDVLSPKPPTTLYHYTTQLGLLGIIKHKTVWATHTQHLNDRLEYLHATEMVRDELKVMRKNAKESSVEKHLDEMAEGIESIECINVCVCSFSEVRDSLPQWKAYGEASAGFAIGFPGSFLRKVGQSHNFYLVRCVYDHDEQATIVRALLHEVLEENIARAAEKKNDRIFPRGGNLGAYLHRYAPILKDSSFAEEREWCLISRPMSCTRDGFSYRAGNSMLIPYYQLPLFTTTSPFRLDEVVVGPTPNPDHSKHSVKSLLVSEGLHLRDGKNREEMVSSSAITYKAW